jgi:hypothetical protein
LQVLGFSNIANSNGLNTDISGKTSRPEYEGIKYGSYASCGIQNDNPNWEAFPVCAGKVMPSKVSFGFLPFSFFSSFFVPLSSEFPWSWFS